MKSLDINHNFLKYRTFYPQINFPSLSCLKYLFFKFTVLKPYVEYNDKFSTIYTIGSAFITTNIIGFDKSNHYIYRNCRIETVGV